jgi:hypothetical protein
MASIIGYLVLVLVVCTASVQLVSAESLQYSKVQLIDYAPTTGNLLFRGNEAVNETSGTFQYDLLVQYMQMRAANASVPFPASFYLVDLSFLNHIKKEERVDLSIEKSFFRHNPKLGELVHHFLMGTLTSPSEFPLQKRLVSIEPPINAPSKHV